MSIKVADGRWEASRAAEAVGTTRTQRQEAARKPVMVRWARAEVKE